MEKKMPTKTITWSPEELIVKHLDDNGQKLSWLADKLECSPGHLFLVLKGDGHKKRVLTQKNREKINEALGTNY